MSNESRRRRREIVARLRQQGRQAYRDGKSRESNPYRWMDRFQWFTGYDLEAELAFMEKEIGEIL